MLMGQQFLKDYFNFTKKERTGNLWLILVLIILLIIPNLYSFFIKTESFDHEKFKEEIARLKIDSSGKISPKNFDNEYYNDYSLTGKKHEILKAELFLFDPNTATLNDWKRLGIKEKTALTIQKYISKGGKFYKPEDIKKIWGIHPAEAERLLPYVRVKNIPKEYPEFEKKKYAENSFSYTPKIIQKISINSADTNAYISLPGIGNKLSKRIIDFRERLGGFYSIDQVSETYFLPDSTFQKIKPYLILDDNLIRKININKASIDEMKTHPYIKFQLANAIVQYREQHGDFNSVEGIKKIFLVTEEMYIKVAHYLMVE